MAGVYNGLMLALARLLKVTSCPQCVNVKVFSRRGLQFASAAIHAISYACGISNPVLFVNLDCMMRVFPADNYDHVMRWSDWYIHGGYSVPALLQTLIMVFVLMQICKTIGQADEDSESLRRLDYSFFLICLFNLGAHFVMGVLKSMVSTDPELYNKMPQIAPITSVLIAISAVLKLFF
jgi:hypothetical protein